MEINLTPNAPVSEAKKNAAFKALIEKGKAAGHLYQPGRKICSAGFLVYVCDHSVSRDRKIYRKKN